MRKRNTFLCTPRPDVLRAGILTAIATGGTGPAQTVDNAAGIEVAYVIGARQSLQSGI